MRIHTIKIDEISKFLVICVLLSSLFFNNGFYIFICIATFTLLFYLLQQPYKSGVFTFMLVQHVLQVIASVWLMNYLGKGINFKATENSTAIIASLGGIIALFTPIIYFQSKMPHMSIEALKNSVSTLSTDKAMNCYIIAFFVASLLTSVAFLIMGLTQIIVSLLKIKWFFFLLFGFLAILKDEKKKQFYIFAGLELVLGFFSYFSEFKIVIYYLVILLLTFISTINIKDLILGSILGVVLVSFALFWSTIKVEYRTFLNQGSKSQTIEVSRNEALGKLYELSGDVDQDRLNSSTVDFLDRLQYTYNFAKAIERVPARIPYQEGDNLMDNLEFVTTLRFLNPSKPTLDNSVKASKYTGLHYAGQKKGVSFSLGYFAEFYIDFGIYGMMACLFVLGIFYSKLYAWLLKKPSSNLVFNYAIVGSFFMEFYAFEMDGTYFLGRLFASILTYIILIQFVFPPILRYVTVTRAVNNNQPVLMKIFRF